MSDTRDVAAALEDRYVIERELGAGGMAVVYLARDKKLDRQVALKVLRPELGAVLGAERFLTEIKISARLDHPHILTLIDSGNADGTLFYVLPFVRGESLRDKLNREHQLAIDEALLITKQVASALDYAHRQGLVHRDIKPENILLQEGEAMLADFGIALAVKEAGGNRLTQTGLSLGTPQYMSPEQATGDRGIDARSDVYSLASVLYEMLAGEPPVTGANAQSMIAKLMTERPTHLRVLRDTVPPHIDAAVAKALAKTPADRFASAGDFARALDARTTDDAAAPRSASASRRPLLVAGIVALVIAAAAGSYALRSRFTAPPATVAVLGQKTQLTGSGAVYVPAISPDGKQLAYLTEHCEAGACKYAIVVQDVGGTTTHTILEGATATYALEWSADRRNLIFAGTIAARTGAFLVSALGGTPRFLTPGVATFYAGGDSLLLGPPIAPDSVYWIRVAGIDGTVRDSIRLTGRGQGLQAISVVPGTNWIVTLILQQPHGLWQIIDRSGTVADHVVNACTCGGTAASDAVWLTRLGHGNGESIVRIALDRTTGHLAPRQDTMTTGVFTNFSVTADGSSMVMDEGTFDFSVWSLDWPSVLTGRYPDARRVARTSTPVAALLSPDGSQLLLRRVVSIGGGRTGLRYSVMPFAGGAETPLNGVGVPLAAHWADAATVAFQTATAGGIHLAEIDTRSGAQRNTLDIPDSTIVANAPLPNGWAWIPASGDRIVVRRAGRSTEIPMPAWYASLWVLEPDATGQHVFYAGINKEDSLGVGAFDLSTGKSTEWAAIAGERGAIQPLPNGALYLAVAETQENITAYLASGPRKLQRLGAAPRPARNISASYDLKRAAVSERAYRADAWEYKVIR